MKAGSPNRTVVIVGAGPAGCTLASLLAKAGREVVVFDDDKRPDLLVGESLIPAVVPMLRELGIEERVAALGTHKPGASFFHTGGTRISFNFQTQNEENPGYAYNVPRPQFDRLLRERAEELGVRFVGQRAELKAVAGGRIELEESSKRVAGLEQNPEWLVDGTGRARLFARLLGIEAERGNRNDVAHFAHFEDFEHDEVPAGHILVSVLQRGWSWRIPLRDCLSVGIVVNKEAAKALGDSPEERLERAIREEPLLRVKGRNARRVTEVMTYTNYQLISKKASGPGWLMLGDAFGFVDPMLSPGLCMAMKSAFLLNQHVFAEEKGEVASYERELREWFLAWQDLIENFYDGRIMRMAEAGNQLLEGAGRFHPGKLVKRHVDSVISGMVAGVETRTPYNRGFLRFGTKRLAVGVGEIADYAVRG